jgi:alkyl-hydroperoxide reductase/thiol specific antioxidant family protein
LEEAQATLMVLAPEPVDQLAGLARREGWAGPVLADPERLAYRAFGLARLPWHRVFTIKTAVMYLGFFLRGRAPGQPGQDVMQQGGDFTVDGDGIIRFAHAGRSSGDRPSVDHLIRSLRAAARAPGA